MRHLLPTLITLFLSIPLHAGLVFDQNPLELKPGPADEVVEAKFTFHNGGDKPITITGLDSNCSCLEANMDKATYQPGEKGSGTATFKVSTFVGKHEKSLRISTNDPKEPEQTLTTIIDIPVIVDVQPKTLQWVLGEAPTAKSVDITIAGPDPVHIKNVTATRDNVTFTLEEVEPGRKYRINLQPKDTETVTIGALRIETDSQYKRHTRQLAFFNIVRPSQTSKK
ncbi:DUF1573 domain-containing protein [Phragmitibacter flavus]|uniref:DUF1573 domain-containing protein n=1 Tax=Phragmitibacter flavus TaxID=2576071 RepID=A0A5R8KF71_9BACT|nr:DUF1573 domain-containing protein [Phragmitibacter flavus]TLD70950.1 DUF1573 domain-containing protein [Phragmitibacter flavus]